MKYLDETHIKAIGIPWEDIVEIVRSAVNLLENGQYSQPLKPYLRFDEPRNRIIAMPAYIGGRFNRAGIKWIASFPDNPGKGIPRAHSVIILNRADTGQPCAIINTALVSGIRTAAVSGFVINEYFRRQKANGGKYDLGIVGFGPIGQLHLQMLQALFPEHINVVHIYDLKEVDKKMIKEKSGSVKVEICDSWEDVFERSEVFITSTVAERRYVNLPPRKGALYINVSLRDFEVDFLRNVDVILVDNWQEVCRENTDIEQAHQAYGLKKEDVYEITALLHSEFTSSISDRSVMFNPMGMAVFDMAIADHYYNLAGVNKCGIELTDVL
ncbi:2,3-diaminopropionate biosynthesis protein SbnB [Puia dinghuensis]|uniref:2,3-diaminopropionate biosynthesis protein SbnB n=1 Tax=Puia dinghuensis TaxID=1792502 RepID=A0A8J2UBT3_9BACT|nr:2,3-diaminopropionate biosynthesis protein SbnB [Puia dinghuensis]GGA93624.1 2,3-diaminopropionate biosynthesis protein SbnB [Puia dinghuensis]